MLQLLEQTAAWRTQHLVAGRKIEVLACDLRVNAIIDCMLVIKQIDEIQAQKLRKKFTK